MPRKAKKKVVLTEPFPPEACLLLKAAKVIEDRGWCRGELVNEDSGHVCMLGGIYTAAYGNPLGVVLDAPGDEMTEAVGDAVCALDREALARYSKFGVPDLNDGVFRSGRQAAGFLRRVAKKVVAEAKE